MAVTTKQILGKIHRWLGLSSGLVVFILGITGCLLAFEEELESAIYKDRRYVKQVSAHRLPADSLIAIAQAALGKEVPLTALLSYEDPSRTVAAIAYHDAPGWNYFNTSKAFYTVYVDPYTGLVQYVEDTRWQFFRLMLMVHYNLLLENSGKWIIGLSTIVFIVLLISGLVLWWPKNKAAARQRFAFRWKSTTQWKRKNYDLHNILGFYALIFSLIIALTGLVWAFPSFDRGVQWVANGGEHSPDDPVLQSDTRAPQKHLVYETIFQDMRKRSPGDQYDITIPADDTVAIYSYSQYLDKGWRWTGFYYDQQTGNNLSVTYYHDRMTGVKLRSMNYDIHAGSIAGLPGRIIMFLVSFICAGLPVTGYYIWRGRRKKANNGKAALAKKVAPASRSAGA